MTAAGFRRVELPTKPGATVWRCDRPARRPRIFFSVGEPSGDVHAANLIRALRRERPDLEFEGYGGPKMAAAGCRLHFDLTALSVMWFLRVLLNIHRFAELVSLADRYFRSHRPDAVVLVDYPGFNWWMARRAKAHGIPVFYYAPPQIWAWASWRVSKMRRFVDHVLCALPFEEKWLRQNGCNTIFVGHPFFDEVTEHVLDEEFVARQRAKPGRRLVILPGSRTQEVTQNLRAQLKTAAIVLSRFPQTRLLIAAFRPHQADFARRMAAELGLPVEIYLQKTPELIHVADCCLAVSGSVSLELLHHEKPTVVVYTISPAAYRLQNWFRRVKYITLVNLLAEEELFPRELAPFDPRQPGAERVPFPEYLTSEDKSQQMADHLIGWLADPAAAEAKRGQLRELKRQVAHAGASQTAARYIVAQLAARKRPLPRPHFMPSNVRSGVPQ